MQIYQRDLHVLFLVLIIIVGTALATFFYCNKYKVGQEYVSSTNNVVVEKAAVVSEVPIENKSATTQSTVDFSYIFNSSPRPENVSNIVGYFAYGAFATYIPDWLAEHWRIDGNDEGTVTTISPKEKIDNRDFSNIVITVKPTDELFNADSLYNNDINGLNSKVLINNEVLLIEEGDIRIYVVERESDGTIYATYYIDGNGKTGAIDFSADEDNYFEYSLKVKEFVKGLRRNITPVG